MTPKEEINSLISRGKTLQMQAQRVLLTGLSSPGASIIGELFVKEVIPFGYQQLSRDIGNSISRSSKKKAESLWRTEARNFLNESESKIKQMSINTKNLRKEGNSTALILKLNKVRRLQNPISIIVTTSTVLEEISKQDLLWNNDIQAELIKRKREADQEKRERAILKKSSPNILKEVSSTDIFDEFLVLNLLNDLPSVKEKILGALDRLHTNDPDSSRHCIISCRAAVELYCIEKGKDGDWKKGLDNILPSETDRRQVKAIWNYLSGKGAHGGSSPTTEEAEYSLRLTITTLVMLSHKLELIRG